MSIDFTGPGLGDGSYHWRARALDDDGATSAWLEFSAGAASFHVDGSPPSAPTGPFQPAGLTISSASGQQSVGFSWGPAFDSGPNLPLTYEVEVSSSATFAPVLNSDVTPTTTYSAFFSPGKYFWRVSAMDAAGNQGPWAGPMTFSVAVAEGPEEPPDDILPCAAGVEAPTGIPIVALLVAGLLLIRRRPRL